MDCQVLHSTGGILRLKCLTAAGQARRQIICVPIFDLISSSAPAMTSIPEDMKYSLRCCRLYNTAFPEWLRTNTIVVILSLFHSEDKNSMDNTTQVAPLGSTSWNGFLRITNAARLSDGFIFHPVKRANFYCSMSSTQLASLSHKCCCWLIYGSALWCQRKNTFNNCYD